MLHIRLKEELARLVIKAAAAAKAIGEPDSQGLRDVIGGRKRLSADMLSMLTAIGIDPLYVLNGQRTSSAPTTPEEQVLLDGFRALDPGMRRRLLAFMLGGEVDSQAEHQQSNVVIATGVGTQAAGKKIVNIAPK